MKLESKRLLKTKDAANYLSCSTWKLRELVRDEKIPHVILGEDDSVWRFDVLDLAGCGKRDAMT